jgi:hypothetical protein
MEYFDAADAVATVRWLKTIKGERGNTIIAYKVIKSWKGLQPGETILVEPYGGFCFLSSCYHIPREGITLVYLFRDKTPSGSWVPHKCDFMHRHESKKGYAERILWLDEHARRKDPARRKAYNQAYFDSAEAVATVRRIKKATDTKRQRPQPVRIDAYEVIKSWKGLQPGEIILVKYEWCFTCYGIPAAGISLVYLSRGPSSGFWVPKNDGFMHLHESQKEYTERIQWLDEHARRKAR